MEKDRREFLEKFVALSSASLLFSVSSIADSDKPEPIELIYGPPPFEPVVPVVPMPTPPPKIYLKESTSKLTPLDKKEDLPLNFTILIVFPKDMSKNKKNLIKFVDGSGSSISFDTKWITKEKVEISPYFDELKYGNTYSIEIDGFSTQAIFTTSIIPK